jgi:uncharacterized protein YcbK (DUF882 family)
MDPEFIRKLDELRAACGWPFIVTSGYRSPTHSIEVKKGIPGTHTQGIAADIKVTGGVQRMDIVQKAMDLGFSGIGVAKGFVHVDTRTTIPVLWVY